MSLEDMTRVCLTAATERRRQERALREDMEEAHGQGLHDGLPREGCPDCERLGGRHGEWNREMERNQEDDNGGR